MDSIRLMREALDEAHLAMKISEVPVGCVIVHDPTDRIIGKGHNLRNSSKDATAHAEIIAIRDACAMLGDWRLAECTLVVTLEPCPMCAGAIINARIPRLIYAADDPKAGAVRTMFQICDDPRLNHRAEIMPGVLSEESSSLLRDFFATQRAMGKK